LAEEHSNRPTHELSLLNNINDVILRSKEKDTLLNEVCQVLVLDGRYKLAWICKPPDPLDPERKIRPIAAFGELHYLESINISYTNKIQLRGPTVTCLRFGKTVVTNNLSASDDFKPWLNTAQKYGISSSIVVQIKFDDNTKGCINIYSDRIDAFDETEVLVLERVASNISYSLINISNNELNKKTIHELGERVKELRTIYLINSILKNENLTIKEFLIKMVDIIPSGWQFESICSACVNFDGKEYTSKNFKPSQVKQTAKFRTVDGKTGYIEVVYDDQQIRKSQTNFLPEESDLIHTLADMFTSYYNNTSAISDLRRSQANLFSVFDNTDVGYLLLDKELNIIAFNKALYSEYARQTGVKIKNEQNLNTVLLGPQKNVIMGFFIGLVDKKRTVTSDVQYELDNITYHYTISVSPILENEEVNGFSVSVINITTRKLQEIERQKMVDDLVQRNSDLEQFAYIVSHNLRAPVANILGLTNLFENVSSQDNRVLQIINGLKESSIKLDHVIKDLNKTLQVKRDIIESKSVVYFKDLIEDFRMANSSLIANSKANINANFDEAEYMVTTRSYLFSIFTNIITNSIKFARPDVPPRIDIWSERKNNRLILNFNDNGTGIDLARYGSQVFGLYKRFNQTAEGRGVGLFMVKNQVESLNGTIKLDSKEGFGTHITIDFDVS